MADKNTKIFREGGKFIYQHAFNKNPLEYNESQIFWAARDSIDANEKATSALSFLHDALETLADTGHLLDKFQIKGVAAICHSISELVHFEDTHHENEIIRAIVAGEI